MHIYSYSIGISVSTVGVHRTAMHVFLEMNSQQYSEKKLKNAFVFRPDSEFEIRRGVKAFYLVSELWLPFYCKNFIYEVALCEAVWYSGDLFAKLLR